MFKVQKHPLDGRILGKNNIEYNKVCQFELGTGAGTKETTAEFNSKLDQLGLITFFCDFNTFLNTKQYFFFTRTTGK